MQKMAGKEFNGAQIHLEALVHERHQAAAGLRRLLAPRESCLPEAQ